MPSPENERKRISKQFQDIWNFPNRLGALDGRIWNFDHQDIWFHSYKGGAPASAGAGCPRIVSREQWGARAPTAPRENMTADALPYVVVHHGGGRRGYCFDQEACAAVVRSYQDLHMDGNGWDDIGYSFLVGEDGNAYEGRGWDAKGAHAPGYNQQSAGICVIGEFSDRLPNAAALGALQQLMRCGVSLGQLRPDFQVLGHRQARNTTCPGDALYDWVSQLDNWTAEPQPCVDGVCPAANSTAPAWSLQLATHCRDSPSSKRLSQV